MTADLADVERLPCREILRSPHRGPNRQFNIAILKGRKIAADLNDYFGNDLSFEGQPEWRGVLSASGGQNIAVAFGEHKAVYESAFRIRFEDDAPFTAIVRDFGRLVLDKETGVVLGMLVAYQNNFAYAVPAYDVISNQPGGFCTIIPTTSTLPQLAPQPYAPFS